jgi:hypothetical protein
MLMLLLNLRLLLFLRLFLIVRLPAKSRPIFQNETIYYPWDPHLPVFQNEDITHNQPITQALQLSLGFSFTGISNEDITQAL